MFKPEMKKSKLLKASLACAAVAGALCSGLSASAQVVVYGNGGGYGRGRPAPLPYRPGGPAPAYGNPHGPVVIGPAPGYSGGGTTVVVRPGRVPPGGRLGGVPPGWGHGRDGRVVVRPPMSGEEHERFVAELFVRHTADLGCDQLGDLLRRISNDVLQAGYLPELPSEGERQRWGESRDAWLIRNRQRQLRNLMRRPQFFAAVMVRLTEAFRGCDRPCFDDGVAIGIISGTGYCNAAIGVGGLPDPGFLQQNRLPLCQTANFVGCQQGYSQAVNQTQGCLSFATGSFYEAFEHQVSQDCHID